MTRYNLPLNDVYDVVDSFNTGGLENACLCENCNKPIVNVAVIKNLKNQAFNVGLDCAGTLQNLKNFYFVDLEFKELKAIQAKLNKAKKENEIYFRINIYGYFEAYYNTTNELGDKVYNREITIFEKDQDFAKKYLKSYLKLVSNPDKIGFNYENKIIDLGVNRFIASENENFKKTIKVSEVDFNISVVKSLRPDGKYNTMFCIESKFLKDKITFHGFNDIERKINYEIRKYKFENFNTKDLEFNPTY